MEKLIMPFQKFKFETFMEKMLEFAEEITDITYAVPWV